MKVVLMKYEQSDSKQSQLITMSYSNSKEKKIEAFRCARKVYFVQWHKKICKTNKKGWWWKLYTLHHKRCHLFSIIPYFSMFVLSSEYTFCSYNLFDMVMPRFCFIEATKISRSIWHTLRKLKAKCNMCMFRFKSTTICLKGGKLVGVKE